MRGKHHVKIQTCRMKPVMTKADWSDAAISQATMRTDAFS
jgi:hypothetical protein